MTTPRQIIAAMAGLLLSIIALNLIGEAVHHYIAASLLP